MRAARLSLSPARRWLVASTAAVAALALSTAPELARADVPPADGGTSDPGCSIAAQSVAGSTCAECVVASGDTSCPIQLGADYNFVCDVSATVQVWCNGPSRTATQNPSCAVPVAPASDGAARVAVALAVAGLAAASLRRRRRP
jgi:MYXO-CTERM domain-containing protein